MKTKNSLFFAFIMAAPVWAGQLLIEPDTFDFGWCPSNEKVSCEFTVQNPTTQLIPITEVRPSCGCTATNFTPADLSSMSEMKIGMTFNTRGYDGKSFSKKSLVKTEMDKEDSYVTLMGQVLNAEAKVLPVGKGVASFEENTKKDTQKIPIINKTAEEVSLTIIQPAANWANVKLASTKIKPGKKTNLAVTVEPPYIDAKHTSITIEAKEKEATHRFTVAIRTGPPPRPVRPRLQAPKKVMPKKLSVPKKTVPSTNK